ncbi:Transposase [Oopsacas minuta]|uniref:Transposase n=1 Tax=Oopsacas minuta TaxID=111878 RepID=A0AAV7JWD0_9METZ|nr:Transposase [Oopsacas minuta]
MASNDDNFNLKWRAYIEFRTILKSTVERWAARFRSGDADVTDLPRSGRPVSATTSESIALIESMVMEDKCITVNQLEQSMEISSGAIHTTLTTELGYRSICGKWVPHKLSENQRRLTEIITGDETWVYYSTPYSKYKKRSWVRGDEQAAKLRKPDFRKPKIMYTIFFSSHGIVLQLPCESGKAVTATFFTEQVLPNLIKNIEKYRPKTVSRGMKILIDNTSSHTAKLTKNSLDIEGLELLPHPPYSPDLAPCDFWLFPKLKIYLQVKDFNTLQALGTGLYQYFKSIPEEEYRNVFYNWVERLKTLCICRRGLF